MSESLSIPPELDVKTERYAVYRCYADDGQLLYIGETGDLGTRLAAHAKKLWFAQVRGITLDWYADELSALNAERRAIHVEHPKYNKQHRNRAIPRKPQSATNKRPNRRRTRTAADARNQALRIWTGNPAIAGAELGRLCGMTPRWGQMRIKEFSERVTGPDNDSTRQHDTATEE